MRIPKLLFILFFCLITFNQTNAQQILINEFLASNQTTNADEDGDFEDWIELYNAGNETVNLEGFGLSDNDNQPYKWVFPSVVMEANEYLLIWASGKNRTDPASELHANFKISAGGEPLSLTNAEGDLLDYVAELPLPSDVSYGRGTGEDSEVFFYFYEPTPGAENTSQTFESLLEKPIFSHASGFYEEGFELSISSSGGATILYTLDGSEPSPENIGGTTYQYKNQYAHFPEDEDGELLERSVATLTYTEAIQIEDRSSLPNELVPISTTFDEERNYFPSEPIEKATVVRAREYTEDVLGPITTNTFFVSAENAFQSSLPILNISVNENDFFDYEDGMNVPGVFFDNWRAFAPNSPVTLRHPANYMRRGRETEKNATFQFFENNALSFEQNVGIRLHGGFTRALRMKSLRIYARSAYDDSSTLDHPFFGEQNDSSFKRLILRNSGQDFILTLLRDAVTQQIVSHLNFDTQAYRPTIHFLNGEYWGIINMRERYDKHYFLRNYSIEEDELDYLSGDGRIETGINEGDNVHWNELFSFIEENDLQVEANYEYVKTQIDTENFTDYYVSNIYFRNTDWPANNNAYFRKRTSFDSTAPYGNDGRWRWVMYDTDFGTGYAGNPNSYTHNTLEFATALDGPSWPNPEHSTLFLRKLLENEAFRTDFITRYADLLNTTFLPSRFSAILNDAKNQIEPEIERHINRWSIPASWAGSINHMNEFGIQRPSYAREHIQDFFNLVGMHQVELNVNDIDQGFIQLNTIEITENTPGVSQNPYPWSGSYYEGVPVTVKAIAKEGYTFSHWSGDISSTEEEVTINLTENTSIVANFEEGEAFPELLYFWLMDNNIPNNTPLETLEPTYVYEGENASAILEYESSLEGYPFDSSHPNWRVASMERRNQPTSINYIAEANNDLPFENVNMRAMQVRQSFRSGSAENTLNFTANTTERQEIKVSFAVMDEGAADELLISYLDENNTWSTTLLPIASFSIGSNYQLIEVDFSAVEVANNNEAFQFRIRFDGEDMEATNGNRVTFNNIAIFGTSSLSVEVPEENPIVIYPNPFRNEFFVKGILQPTTYQLYNLQSNLLLKGELLNNKINTEALPSGMYLLVLKSNTKTTYHKVMKR